MEPTTQRDLKAAAARAARVAWIPVRDAARERQLRAAAARRRGLIQAAVGLGVAGLLAWRVGRTPAALAAAVAVALAVLALGWPLGALARVERGVARFAVWVGTAVAWLLMTPLYYLVVTPLGLVLRARGRLRLRRRPDARAASYWTVLPEQPPGPESYEKQF